MSVKDVRGSAQIFSLSDERAKRPPSSQNAPSPAQSAPLAPPPSLLEHRRFNTDDLSRRAAASVTEHIASEFERKPESMRAMVQSTLPDLVACVETLALVRVEDDGRVFYAPIIVALPTDAPGWLIVRTSDVHPTTALFPDKKPPAAGLYIAALVEGSPFTALLRPRMRRRHPA